MTPETRQEIERLDRWLAVQDVAGVRFYPVIQGNPDTPRLIGEVASGTRQRQCTINHYRDEAGSGAIRTTPQWVRDSLYQANDSNDGDPKAVRAELHRLYPFLAVVPEPVRSLPQTQEQV